MTNTEVQVSLMYLCLNNMSGVNRDKEERCTNTQ